MIKLSIIIPYYNSPKLLRTLLNSIVMNAATQIIVVDDHSTQGLEEYQDLIHDPAYRQVSFISNKLNKKGAGSARNTGLECADGKYILFCDADDYLIKGYDQIIAPYLEAEWDLVYFSLRSVYLKTQTKADRADKFVELIDRYLKQPSDSTSDNLRFTFYIPTSKLIKRSLIEKHQIRFDEIMVSEDVMFSAKIGAKAESIQASSELIYCLTRSEGTLTMARLEQSFNTRFQVGLELHRLIRATVGVKRYQAIDLPALIYILQAFQYKLGFKKAWWVYLQLKHNKIRVLSISLCSLRKLRQFSA